MIRTKLRVLLLGIAMIGTLVAASGLTGLTGHAVGQGKAVVAQAVGTVSDEQVADAASCYNTYDYGRGRNVCVSWDSTYVGGGKYVGWVYYRTARIWVYVKFYVYSDYSIYRY